ncbi:formyltransferase family protein [Laspinema palackyanum]|uniref:formyltransferase family protein n=1 Tax=Laspinema palackyanum TaxID=3231601 RepID=UPI00345CD85E|nr:hypothetical protein [Laspinema sp. D2c]
MRRAGWMRIVTPVLIDAFPSRILNLHRSLLPSFKGGHGVEKGIREWERVAIAVSPTLELGQ